jgi:hypothetical protein
MRESKAPFPIAELLPTTREKEDAARCDITFLTAILLKGRRMYLQL